MQLGGGPDAANKPIADDVLANHIFPYLLDPADPTSTASLTRVCKQWHNVLQREQPYRAVTEFKDFKENYPEMAQLAESGLSKRASYLGSFPKTLYEKMVKAYNKTDANTSFFESNVLVPILAANPHILEQCPWLLLLSKLPSMETIRAIRTFPRPPGPVLHMNTVITILRSHFILLAVTVGLGIASKYLDCENLYTKTCSDLYKILYVCAWGSLATFFPYYNFLDNGSLLNVGYRTAKCGLSALSACAKTTCSKIRNWWTGAYS